MDASLDVQSLVKLFSNAKIAAAETDDVTFRTIAADLMPAARSALLGRMPYDTSHTSADMADIFGVFLANMERVPLGDAAVNR
jgi:hypothetical protein